MAATDTPENDAIYLLYRLRVKFHPGNASSAKRKKHLEHRRHEISTVHRGREKPIHIDDSVRKKLVKTVCHSEQKISILKGAAHFARPQQNIYSFFLLHFKTNSDMIRT